MLYIHTNMQKKLIHKIKKKKKIWRIHTNRERTHPREKKSLFLSCYDEFIVVRKPGRDARNLKRGSRSGAGGTMAAGPGVSMQSCSPARELSVSVQQGGNQTHGDRVKTEEVTGKNATRALFFVALLIIYFGTWAING